MERPLVLRAQPATIAATRIDRAHAWIAPRSAQLALGELIDAIDPGLGAAVGEPPLRLLRRRSIPPCR